MSAQGVISRAEWGAKAPRSRTKLSTARGNTVHYEGPKMGPYAHEQCAQMVRGIQAFHMAPPRNWVDIAYSTMTCRHGYVFLGRGYGIRTAANGTNPGNDQSYAHCVLIGVGDDFSDVAQDAVRWVVEDFERQGSGTKRWVHSDWLPTGCPGDTIRPWVRLGMPDTVPDIIPKEHDVVVLNAPQVALLSHPTWSGYIEVCADGGVINRGDCPFFGSLGSTKLNAPIVGAAVSPTGKGYVMVGADGGVFPFGDIPFKGGRGPEAENAPFTSIAVTATGQGYWLGGRDGGIFAFGDAEFMGAGEYKG